MKPAHGGSSTYTKATITIAAVAGVLAVALIAASPAHAQCTPTGPGGAGGTGNDVLCGTSASETMSGFAGIDKLFGAGGNDLLDGGLGGDSLFGESGNDFLIGGPGVDLFDGGSGNDQLRARDGLPDAMPQSRCGSGTDSLDMDLADAAVFGLTLGLALLTSGCENVTVGAVNEGPNVKISRRAVRVGEDGRAAVRLTCPASLQAPCAGKLRIGRTPKSEGAPKAYSIDQGKKENVSARLSRRDRRKLSQRGRITVGATSVEQGQHGDKTTVQTIKLIAQD